MFNKKQKEKEESALMKYRFVNTRANDKSIMIVRNVVLPKLAHVVAGDVKVTLNPLKKTAQLYVGDVEDDTKVEKVEIIGESNVKIDLHIIYKISGEAYFEQYYNKKYDKVSKDTSNKELLAELNGIKTKLISSKDGNLLQGDYFKIKEVLNILLHRDITDDDFLDDVRSTKNAISHKINNMDEPFDLNIIDDVINDAKIILEQPINSNDQDNHRKKISEFKKLGFFEKIDKKLKWQYNHGAIKVYSILEKDPSFIVKVVESEVSAHIKTMCAQMDYEEVKNLRHIKENVVADINDKLEKYGIEVTSVIVKSVDQASEELDKAADQVKVAKKLKEAEIIKAQGEAASTLIKAEAEAEAERKKQLAQADGIGAKAQKLEESSLGESTKTALAGANVSTYNFAGLDSALGAVASGFNQQHSANPNTNNFRETSSLEDEDNTFKFWDTDDADENEVEANQNPIDEQQEVNQNPVDEQQEANQTSNEMPEMNVAELYINLERLQRTQKRALAELNNLVDSDSAEYKAIQSDIGYYQEQIDAIEKKLKK